MDRIADAEVWISDIRTVRNRSTQRFDRVVTVCQDTVKDNVGCKHNHFNLSDGEPEGHNPGEFSYDLFREAAETVENALRSGETVLVLCHAGLNRSPAVASAALASINESDLEDEIEKMRRCRSPLAVPTQDIRRFAERYVG